MTRISLAVPQSDLDQIVEFATADLETLRDAHIFVTGGTGYIGRWLLEALLFANPRLSLNLSLTVLSRDPAGFCKTHAHLTRDPAVAFVEGDVRSFIFPSGKFTHAIHAATDVVATSSPLETFSVTTTGTKHFLDFCAAAGIGDVLLLSSGAVYGTIPSHIDNVPEDFSGAPDCGSIGSAYGIGKRASEWLGTAYSAEMGIRCRSARVFAQVGPYLALDRQFAAGNFVRDVIRRSPIVIRGDGTPLRSYMYATDLVIWLLAILVRGSPATAYNVGSDEPISISALAAAIARAGDWAQPEIQVLSKASINTPPERYVPAIARARDDLGLSIRVSIEDSLRRTIEWYRPRVLEATAE